MYDQESEECPDILHNGIKRWKVSACAARFAVPAQVKADEDVSSIGERLGNMGIACRMFTKPMHEGNDRFRLAARWLPALDLKGNAICPNPLRFEFFHFIFPR